MTNEFTIEELNSLIGKIIANGNIEIISAPSFHSGEYRCLANINGALCLIAVTIHKL